MKTVSAIQKIDNLGLCLGCGLCESVCGKDSVEMKLKEDGFIRPVVKVVVPEKEEVIKRICPGINLLNDIPFDKEESVWGHISSLKSGYSNDQEVRTMGSSGGIVSAVAIFMLQRQLVDAVMQVGGNKYDYERNTLKISTTREEIIACASSRYAPAHVFNNIRETLDSDSRVYLFIGKPCDITALKNFIREFPEYTNRFKMTMAIFCAGMPSFNGTSDIIDQFGAERPVENLVYRGNGWPGYFSFRDGKGQRYQKTYNDSWGKTLNRHLKLRCKLCPDGIGIQADIAVGDAWETNDGYPDFAEKEGQSLIISRTALGDEVLQAAQNDLSIELSPLKIEKIKMMQPYQYNRRTKIMARLSAFFLAKGVRLNFKNLHIVTNSKKVKLNVLIREFLGTYKRLIR